MSESEAAIQARILLKLGARPDVRLFRNTVGFGYTGKLVREDRGVVVLSDARPVTFGLAPKSADIVGWHTVEITPEMVGRKLAVFTSIEVKKPGGHIAGGQSKWCNAVQNAGGVAGISRSVADAETLLL